VSHHTKMQQYVSWIAYQRKKKLFRVLVSTLAQIMLLPRKNELHPLFHNAGFFRKLNKLIFPSQPQKWQYLKSLSFWGNVLVPVRKTTYKVIVCLFVFENLKMQKVFCDG